MKNIFSTLLCCFISILTLRAQDSGLRLSNIHPEPAKQLSAIYDPGSTLLTGKTSIEGRVFYWNDKNRCIPLKALITDTAGKKKITFRVPEFSKALIFTFVSQGLIDNNAGRGYIYPVYETSKPVKGAWANIASLYIYGNKLTNIAQNQTLAAAAMQNELNLYPTGKKDFAATYYEILMRSPVQADKVLLEKELITLSNSHNEADAIQAISLYAGLKRQNSSDSLKTIAIKRFPHGELASDARVEKIYDEKDVENKEALYSAWIRDFPPAPHGDHIDYDYARYDLAIAYAKAGKNEKAIAYIDSIETGVWQGNAYSGLAEYLVKNNDLKDGEILIKRAIDTTRLYITTRNKVDGADFAVSGYSGLLSTYANILYREKRYNEALINIKVAYANANQIKGNLNENYALILQALGKNQEAFDKINEAVTAGQGTDAMKENLRALFIKVKGTDKGYDEYLTALDKQLTAELLKQLPGQMLNYPAPLFTLSDVDGNIVSLAGLKGKIVVLDFWATWCGPCKASFPAMQMAVNKFKDDHDVKFLFIHTWERGTGDARTDARKYVTEMKYTFQVLMDLKDRITGVNKAIESYNVSGIPTKFVIDRNGNIRFRLTGFTGGNDAAVEELSAMINLAKNASN